MKYNWDKKVILNRLKQAIKENDSQNIENYKIMLDIMNEKFDLHCVDVVKDDDKLTYGQMKEHFCDCLEYIPKDIVNFTSSLFTMENDLDKIYEVYKHDKIDLTNKELMELGYDIISSFKNPYIIEKYKEFVENKKHILNISEISPDKMGLTTFVNGTTFYDNKRNEAFVSLHKYGTYEDIVTLMHEFMHAMMAYEDRYVSLLAGYFIELEGHFGERLAIEYMRNHGMTKQADIVEAENIVNVLFHSFMIYLNDVLYSTSKNSSFRVREATKVVRKETKYKDFTIDHKAIPAVCSYNAFNEIVDIMDYLIILELSNKYDIDEQYRMILELKKNDDEFFYNRRMPDMFDFLHNDADDFYKLKKRIDKKKRVIN